MLPNSSECSTDEQTHAKDATQGIKFISIIMVAGPFVILLFVFLIFIPLLGGDVTTSGEKAAESSRMPQSRKPASPLISSGNFGAPKPLIDQAQKSTESSPALPGMLIINCYIFRNNLKMFNFRWLCPLQYQDSGA